MFHTCNLKRCAYSPLRFVLLLLLLTGWTALAYGRTISGRVTDGHGSGITGVRLTLSNAQTATTQTDASGNYSFVNLPEGNNYTVTPSKTNYTFAPGTAHFIGLYVDGTANFTGTLSSAPGEPATGLQYYPLPRPIRLLDTRPGEPACDTPGTPLTGRVSRTENARLTCNEITIPADARAVVGNATVVNTGVEGGYVTLYPSGTERPTVSNLNYAPAQVVPNAFTVGLGSDGAFNIYATSSIHFIVDITGYYAPPDTGGLYYHPLPSPIRLLDTRPGEPACDMPGLPLTGGTSRATKAHLSCHGVTIPASARVIVGNATVVNTVPEAGSGFITLYPSGVARPTVSNLNYVPGQVVPNAFTVSLGSDGAFDIYALSTTHFIVDITGYYSDQVTDENGAGLQYYALPRPVRLLDTRPGQPACDTPGTALAGETSRTEVAGLPCTGIPSTAQAVVGNATVDNNPPGSTSGYITLYPSSAARPTVSNLNYMPGQVVPNAFTVGLGSDGAFNIYALSTTHFIVDMTGYYAP